MTALASILAAIDDRQNALSPDEFEDEAREVINELLGRIHNPRVRDYDARRKDEDLAP